MQASQNSVEPVSAEAITDGELLDQFVARGSHSAFASIVHRHQAMVWSVCRRMLGQHADAEDAFQAVFLVLIARATALRGEANIGPWLYGVTCNTALKQRATQRKRREQERHLRPLPAGTSAADAETLAILDEEIRQLPEKYRRAVVLCELQGCTRQQASRLLAIPEGTLSSRLAAARDRLGQRLARRGVVLGAISLAALLTPSSAPAAVLAAVTLQPSLAAAGAVGAGASAPVAALAQGVLHAMFLKQLKTGAVALALTVAVTAGTLWIALAAFAGGDETQDDRQRIVGEWKPLAITDGGRERPTDDAKMIFTKDSVELIAGKKSQKFPYSLDPAQNPKWINTKSADGTKDVLGIYKFENNKLHICINEVGGGERPTQFVSEDGTANDLLIVLERAKKE